MANNRQIVRAIATLVMLITVLPIFATAFACGNHTCYTLTITTTLGGTTCPAPGTHTYTNGTIVTITAFACSGHQFSHWIVDNLSNSTVNPIMITMNQNHTIEAVFVAVAQNFALTITTTSGGTTSPEPGTYSYPQGTNVTVTAVPDEGYELSSWLLDGSYAGSSNNITITMNSNHDIQAVFSTVVPEFPTAVPLVIFSVAALFLALLYKKTDRLKKPTSRP